jgi:hypothetical protein
MAISSALVSFLIFLASIAIGVAGLYMTGYVFNTMHWCCFHSWALAHGTGVVCFLFWAYFGFHVVSRLAKISGRFSLVPNLAYICGALGTFYFTQLMMWPGLILCSLGAYRRIRHGDVAAAGLIWSAVLVNVLSFSYWLYMKILYMNI